MDGWFVGFCTTAILFYYSVVCGWSLKYFVLSISGQITNIDHTAYWQSYTASIYQPVLYHLVSIIVGGYIIYHGVIKGVEKYCKIMIPALFTLLIIAAIKALTLTGSEIGRNYFFELDLSTLFNAKIWLDGLSQSAWSTGAGWGLILTYSIYARKDDNIISNSFITGIGNNMASIIAGLAIIPTVFALSSNIPSAYEALDSGNQGLAFIIIPQLFIKMNGGTVFSGVFFLALFIAAISSLISMIELAVRIMIDFGFSRKNATLIICISAFFIGMPSAISIDIFNNQDWVWGLGLMLSGAFFTFAVIKIKTDTFIDDWLKPSRYVIIYKAIFKILFYICLPIEFVIMLGWWLWQSIQWNPSSWWNPLSIYGVGGVLLQWIIILLIGLIFNHKFVF
ncbi:MAG: sodium-dependent transporter, partial [Calditrichaceae bacterium]|nr:sodium-dependent transporter [Calditrichaceae bacterium]